MSFCASFEARCPAYVSITRRLASVSVSSSGYLLSTAALGLDFQRFAKQRDWLLLQALLHERTSCGSTPIPYTIDISSCSPPELRVASKWGGACCTKGGCSEYYNEGTHATDVLHRLVQA